VGKINFLERQSLLHQAANDFGFESMEEMLASALMDGVCPAICSVCGATEELEPDGYCECPECGGLMKSVLLIAGMI